MGKAFYALSVKYFSKSNFAFDSSNIIRNDGTPKFCMPEGHTSSFFIEQFLFV